MSASLLRLALIAAFWAADSLIADVPRVTLGSSTQILAAIEDGSTSIRLNRPGLHPRDVIRLEGDSGFRTVVSVEGDTATLDSPVSGVSSTTEVIRIIGSVTHTSAQVFWTVPDPEVYVSVKFGTQSGVYSYRTPGNYQRLYGSRIASMQLNALAPDTTFFLRTVTHPPNRPQETCDTDECGSLEVAFSTPPAGNIHPEPPDPPATFSTAAPDTSEYVVFQVPAFPDGAKEGTIEKDSTRLTVNSAEGLQPNHWIFIDGAPCPLQPPRFTGCQIDSVDPENNIVILKTPVSEGVESAAVTWALYTVQDFLNPKKPYRLGYGTIFEWAQGYKGKWIPIQESYGSIGLKLPGLPPDNNPACGQSPCSLDDPAHRWIILRTAEGPGLLPPPDVRTGPAWEKILGAIVAQMPNSTGNGGEVLWGGDSSYTTPPHHFRIENLELTVSGAHENFPDDAIDPRPYSGLISFDGRVAVATPRHVVLDRVYIHGAPPTSRVVAGVSVGGEYMALINSYIHQIDYWQVYKTLSAPCSLSAGNTVLTIPQDSFQRNKWEPEWTMPGPATATLSASGDYSGAFMVYMSPGGPHIEFTTLTTGSASIDCVNCTASDVASPATPYNRVRWCNGTISSGQFTFSDAGPYRSGLSLYATEGSYGITIGDGAGPYVISNNYSEAYGINFFIDSAGLRIPAPSDVIFSRNHLFWNEDHRHNSATSDGFKYYVRNLWEIKRGKRWVIDGNIFEGNFSSINQGSSILLSSRPPAGGSYNRLINSDWGGISDIRITNNIIRNGSAGFYCQGDLSQGPARKVLFANNLLYGIDNYTHSVGRVGGALGDNIRVLFGCHDLDIRHNTFGSNLGPAPFQILSGSQIWNEGVAFQDNIVYLNMTPSGGISVESSRAYTPWQPAFNGSDFKSSLDSTILRLGKEIVPDYRFDHNIIIGGIKGDSPGRFSDLSDEEIKNLMSKYGDLAGQNYFPGGNTKELREKDIWGGVNLEKLPASTDGKPIGADLRQVETAVGQIKDFELGRITSESAVLSYTPPDSFACYVDWVTASGAPVRLRDAGTPGRRSVTLSGLPSGTDITYRVLCASEQILGSFQSR